MASKKKQFKPIKNPKHELFCRHYTSFKPLFGNATHAYAETYNYKLESLSKLDAVYEDIRDADGKFITRKLIKPSSYDSAVNVCAVEGARVLRNPKVNQRIIDLLNELMRDEVVDSELAKVIMQDEDRSSKVAGIKEYNNIKSRTKKRLELTGPNGTPLFDEDAKTKSKNAIKDFLTRTNTGDGK